MRVIILADQERIPELDPRASLNFPQRHGTTWTAAGEKCHIPLIGSQRAECRGSLGTSRKPGKLWNAVKVAGCRLEMLGESCNSC